MPDASPRKFHGLFIALGLLVSVLVVVGYYKDQFRDWKTYQEQFVKEEIKRAAAPQQRLLAENTPIQIRQIVLPEPTIPITTSIRSISSAARSAIAGRVAPRRRSRPTATWPIGTSRCCRCATSRPPAASAIKPPTIRRRQSWPAANWSLKQTDAVAATNSAGRAECSVRNWTRWAPGARPRG